MHPIDVFMLYENNWGKVATEEFQLEDAEINCGEYDLLDEAPFHFMKLQVFVEREKLEERDRGWEELTEGYSYKLLDFEEDQHLLEALKNEPPEKFFYTIYFWPDDAYQELVEEYEETEENYWDEGTGDWSRDIEWNSSTIERLVAMLQEGKTNE